MHAAYALKKIYKTLKYAFKLVIKNGIPDKNNIVSFHLV